MAVAFTVAAVLVAVAIAVWAVIFIRWCRSRHRHPDGDDDYINWLTSLKDRDDDHD